VMMPAFSAAEVARLKEAADRQKNWALMTPEEILGVPTPETVLGADAEKNQTTLDRYYERQQKEDNTRTNKIYSRSRDDAMTKSSALFPALIDNGNNENVQNDREPSVDIYFGGTPNPSAAHAADNSRNLSSLFPDTFGSTVPAPARTPEQASADEAQFQRLLTPNSPAAQPAFENASPFSASTSPGSVQPRPNPIGNTYAPLNNNIGVPEGIKPLPGLIDQKSSTTPVAPGWQPQTHLAPWMSPTPPLGTFPQR